MEPYLLASLVLMVLALLWRDRRFDAERHVHAEEIKASRTDLALLHVAHAQQMHKLFDAHREDIALLCQRIQAPELAVVEHQQAGGQDPNPHPLTDEQLAAEQERAAVIERIERIENEGLLQ